MKMNIKLLTLVAVLAAANHMHASSVADASSGSTTTGAVPTTQPFMHFHPMPGHDGSGTQSMPGHDGHGQKQMFGPGGTQHLFGPNGTLHEILTLLQQATPDVPGAIAKLEPLVGQDSGALNPNNANNVVTGGSVPTPAPADTAATTTVQS